MNHHRYEYGIRHAGLRSGLVSSSIILLRSTSLVDRPKAREAFNFVPFLTDQFQLLADSRPTEESNRFPSVRDKKIFHDCYLIKILI